jgi:hypothetical protein
MREREREKEREREREKRKREREERERERVCVCVCVCVCATHVCSMCNMCESTWGGGRKNYVTQMHVLVCTCMHVGAFVRGVCVHVVAYVCVLA